MAFKEVNPELLTDNPFKLIGKVSELLDGRIISVLNLAILLSRSDIIVQGRARARTGFHFP